jgi:hypothetical protein
LSIALQGTPVLVGVSSWPLARVVAMRGQLGVVSGAGTETTMVLRLQDGDPGGHLRRSIARFPLPEVANDVLRRYFLLVISAASHERVVAASKARYVIGLTATPKRRDGHHPILEMQLGPVRFAIDSMFQAARRPFDHKLIARETAFRATNRCSRPQPCPNWHSSRTARTELRARFAAWLTRAFWRARCHRLAHVSAGAPFFRAALASQCTVQ